MDKLVKHFEEMGCEQVEIDETLDFITGIQNEVKFTCLVIHDLTVELL